MSSASTCSLGDFLAVHVYPEKDKVNDAIATLKGFAAAGKPVIVEEMYPLRCGADQLDLFIDRSQKHAAGWIGFYWGKTPKEYRKGGTLGDSIALSWLELFQEKNPNLDR